MGRIRRKKKYRRLLFLAVFIIMAVWVFIKLYKYTDVDIYSGKPVPVTDSYDEDNTGNDVWYLILVNRWNPIPDDYDLELVQLPGGECVDIRIYPQLKKMLDDMQADGLYPVVVSGYRTAEKQQQIYDDKMSEYLARGCSRSVAAEKTGQWVAVPGTSEHQLGLGVDINADGINSYGHEVYEWLDKNAYRYGFIYRYQEDKIAITGVSNEPWHYRYVGVRAATQIHRRGICLEEYINSL